MKASFVLIGVATLLVGTVFAGPDVIIKQRAREIRNQNNVRQGVAPPTQPPPQQAAPAGRTKAAPPSAVQQNLALLRADLMAIKPNVPVTSAQRLQITSDLMSASQGPNKVSRTTAANLAASLASAFAQKPLLDKDCSRLMSDLAVVLNPARTQPTQAQAVYDDIQAIFQANGMARADALKIVDQVKAVAAETQK